MKPGAEDTTSVLVAITVPMAWTELRVEEIEEKVRSQRHLPLLIAQEIKRWAGEELTLEEIEKRLREVTDG